jgi:uncharacterized membrane protein YwzB
MSLAHSKVFFESLRTSDFSSSPWPRIGWGLFLSLVLGALGVAFGLQISLLFIVGVTLAAVCAWRLPYFLFFASIFTAPMIGWLVSVSTGTFQFGARAFGGSIDVPVADLFVLLALAAWGMRILFIWGRHQELFWKPWLPLVIPYGALVAVHLATILSPAQPDPLMVIKYTLRPVLFAYLASVALPVNFLRSRRRLETALLLILISGTLFAFDGFLSLFVVGDGIHQARPLPWFGVYPIGDNHNVLAEWLLFAAPAALAYAQLTNSVRAARLSRYSAVFMTLIALLTFARSAWITLMVEVLFLSMTLWSTQLKRAKQFIVEGLLLFSPLAIYMIFSSSSAETQGSTDARAMLAGIAIELFRESPIIGVGAGTFVNHVAGTWAFIYEYGSPLDSHGYLQKLAAETGLLGLLAFTAVIITIGWYLWSTWKELKQGSDVDRTIFAYLCSGVIGAFIYQIFNTTYWTPKLWLPVGIALAASRMLVIRRREQDPSFLITKQSS